MISGTCQNQNTVLPATQGYLRQVANMEYYLSLFFMLLLIFEASAQTVHRRFEYKYSFKGPYLAQKNNQVPFWTYSGNAIASEESFRITPSLRSQKGQAWSTNPINFDWWEVEVVFRVNGRGRIGADGLAFWYTAQQGVEGPVFGSSDKWNGLGLFFDSFDNDNKRNNPYIMAMVNDGSLIYDHEHDGLSQQLGGCLRDFRNKPFPIRAKIEYYKNVLTIQIHSGMTESEKDYELCLRSENVFLPPSGHFGISAATGGLADDHDVLRFVVNSLRSSEEMAHMRVGQEEEEKFQKEFEQYQQKTQKAREDYIAEHPDAIKPDQQEEYETDEQRELRQIFQGQGQIFEVVRQLHVKMDEIIGKQERTMSLVSAVQGGIPPPVPGQPAPQIAGIDSIRRHEVESLMTGQREVVQNARDIKNSVIDIQSKSNQILTNSQRAQGSVQPAGGAAGGYDMHITLKEMNEGLNIIKRDLGMVNQRLASGPSAAGLASCPSCVSTSVLAIFLIGQLGIVLAYFIYRDSKEANAKKFY